MMNFRSLFRIVAVLAAMLPVASSAQFCNQPGFCPDNFYQSGGSVPVVPTLGVMAATRGQLPLALTSGWTQNVTYRKEYWSSVAGDISNLQTIDVNWYFPNTTSWTTIASYGIKRFLEYPANTFTPILWSGASTVTLLAGSGAHVALKSDPINITIPKGTKFWIRTVWLSGQLPIGLLPGGPSTIGVDDGNTVGDFGDNGTVPALSGQFNHGPVAILGDVNATNARSFFLIGDSINAGYVSFGVTGDISSVGPGGGSGYMGRAADTVGGYTKLAQVGWKAQEFALTVAAAGRLKTLMDATNYSDLWLEFGINDLGAGRTPAQLLTDMSTIAAGKRTGSVVGASTITAVASGSNTIPWSQAANGASYNASIRARPAWLTGRIYDAGDASMTTRDSFLWKFTSFATDWAADGTHPTSLGAANVAAGIGAP